LHPKRIAQFKIIMTSKKLILILFLLKVGALLSAQTPFITSFEIEDLTQTLGIQSCKEGLKVFMEPPSNKRGIVMVYMDEQGEIISGLDTVQAITNSPFFDNTSFLKHLDGNRYFIQYINYPIHGSPGGNYFVYRLEEDLKLVNLNKSDQFNSPFRDCQFRGLFQRGNKLYTLSYYSSFPQKSFLISHDIETGEQSTIDLDMPDSFNSTHIIETTNNELIVGGFTREFNTYYKYVVRFDSTFKYKDIHALPKESKEKHSGPLLLYLDINKALNYSCSSDNNTGITTKSLYCFDINTGQKIWEQESEINQSFEWISNPPLRDEAGSIFLPGTIFQTDSNGVERSILTLDKYSPDGSHIWTRTYSKEGFLTMRLNHIELLSDGRIMGGGFVNLENGKFRPFVFLTDEHGCLEVDCEISSQVSDIFPAPIHLSVFPNPASNFITFHTEIERGVNSNLLLSPGNRLLIKNLQGQMCLHQNLGENFVGSHSTIDISGLPAGLFFAQIESSNGKSLSNIIKFVKQ